MFLNSQFVEHFVNLWIEDGYWWQHIFNPLFCRLSSLVLDFLVWGLCFLAHADLLDFCDDCVYDWSFSLFLVWTLRSIMSWLLTIKTMPTWLTLLHYRGCNGHQLPLIFVLESLLILVLSCVSRPVTVISSVIFGGPWQMLSGCSSLCRKSWGRPS